MRRAILVPVTLLALAACQDGPAAPAGRPPPPPAPPGVSAALHVRDARGSAGPFRLDDVAQLAIEARYTSAEPGPHPVRIDVVAPGGTLYAQLHAAGADGSGASLHTLEVHGTPIEGFRQVGRWHFALSVGASAPLASAEVDLTE